MFPRLFVSTLLVLVCALLGGCGGSPRAVPVEGFVWQSLTLGQETRESVPVRGTLALKPPEGAESVQFALGNESGERVEAEVQAAAQWQGEVPAGGWREVRVPADGGPIIVETARSGVFVSYPFFEKAAQDARPNLLVVSVDTLRYDHFTPERMPATYELFDGGARFERVYSTAPWTIPAHASLFTSMYPASHSLRDPSRKLAPALITLAEVLQDAGYYTLALTESNYMSAAFGFEQGFHLYHEDGPDMDLDDPEKISRLAPNLQLARKKLAVASGGPLFLFFHTFEVHCPYLPRLGRKDPNGVGKTDWLLEHDGKPLGAATVAKLKDLYAGEAAYADQQLAPFIGELLRSGDWLVVFLSDHGEEFYEHGGLLHASTVYEEAMRIPVALAGPGVSRHTDSGLRSIIDVPVTILDLLDVPAPSSWKGRNLFEDASGQPWIFGESFFFGDHKQRRGEAVAAVWQRRHKLIQKRRPPEVTAELYNLAKDTRERRNLLERSAPKAVRVAMSGMIERYLNGQGIESPEADELSAEQLEALRALGYIQ